MLHKSLSELLFTQDVTADFAHGRPQCSCARCLVPICVAKSWRAIRQQGFAGRMRTIYHQDMDTSTQRSSEQLVRELGGLCSSTCTSERNLSLLSTTQLYRLLLHSRAPEEEGNNSSPHCHVTSLACASDLLPITHLSLSESRQLLRKTPGCSLVPGRTFTRQSFLQLRAGVSLADWQALLTV